MSAVLTESDARDLLALANEDPTAARPRALELLSAALDDGNDRMAAITGRAAGLSEAYVGDLSVSIGYLEAAADAARRAGDIDLEGEAEMTLGAVRCWAGENTAGLRSLDRAIAMLSGAERARALVQRGSVRYRAAEFEASLADFDAAEAPLRDAGDGMWLAHLFNNRGLSRAYRGSLPDAEADLEQALELYTGLGHRFSVAQMHHNLGWVAAQLGDVPRALGRFDEAEAEYVQLGSQPAELFRDRSSALISVHLAEEAFATAMRAADLLERDGHAAGRAEALVRAADAALLAERYDEALACAEEAQRALTAQQRSGWAQYAEVIALRARGGRGDIEPARWRRAGEIADALGSAGLQAGAAAARVLAADLAVVAGDYDAARGQMERVRLTSATAAIDLRAEAWYVTARLRLAQGDRRGAARAVDAGLRVVEHHQATLGATETRAHAAGHAKRLAALGVQLAWDSGRPRRILRWLERTRAGTLRFPPVRVPDDAALAGDLAELRLVDRQQRSVEIAPAEESRLSVRRRRLEAEIQRRTRRASGGVSRSSAANVDQLLAELGSRALVEYGRVGEHLVMLTAIDGVVRRHTGPRIAEVVNSIDMLRVGLARLAHGRASEASRAAAHATVLAAAGELSGMLLEPLRLGDRELVLVPPPALHAMAWGLLPAALGRPIAVSPSAELWLRRRGPVNVSRPVLLAGPRLPEAPAEIAAVNAVYDDAATFDPTTGSVAAVRAALERGGLAHLACHGRFRADNPLFSALEFSDGWFTVYDFEGLSSVPDLMVLSACDAGLSAERPGDEVMGIVAGLLGAGARSVVASVGLVPDSDGTREVMVDFHRRLAAGERVGVALASAQEQASRAGDLASASFVCFGYS